MMNNQELKQAIIDDIEFLKTAKIDILDESQYYSKLKKYGWSVFALVYLPVLILGLIFIKFSLLNHIKDALIYEDYLIACAGAGIIIPILFSLSFLTKIMNWIVFEEFLLPHLKTKEMIKSYLNKYLKLYWTFYLGWLAVGMFIFNPILTFMLEIGAMIFVTFIVDLMIYAEFTRIGASVFFEYLSNFFDKEIKELPLK